MPTTYEIPFTAISLSAKGPSTMTRLTVSRYMACVAVFLPLLILGWATDHWRLANQRQHLEADCKVVTLKRELKRAVWEASQATGQQAFETANREGLSALNHIREIEKERDQWPGVAVGECIEACAIPETFNDGVDYLLSLEASGYLVRNGSCSISIFTGMINDDRPHVRKTAIRGLQLLAGMSHLVDQQPITRGEAERLAKQLRRAAQLESDPSIARDLEEIIRSLLANDNPNVIK